MINLDIKFLLLQHLLVESLYKFLELEENTVAVHIRHLREKIEIDPAEPRYLKVVWGLGYKIEKGGA